MAEDINLLPEITEKETKKAGITRGVNIVAIVFLLITLGVLGALLGWNVYLSSSMGRVEEQTKNAEEKILKQSSKEINHRLLIGKLDEAGKFLSSATPYFEGVKKIYDIILQSGALITKSELKNNGTFTISGEAQNSDILGSVTDGLTNKEQQTLFGNVKLVKLVKEKDPDNQNPPYQFTIDVNYLKKGLLPEPSKSSKEK